MTQNGATTPSDLNKVGRLHVITTETLQTQYSHAEIAKLAARGGADVVQYREKRNQSTQTQLQSIKKMNQVLQDTCCGLVVNDRSDLARAAHSGLHIGPNDIAPEVARAIVGPDSIIGATANNLEMLDKLLDAPIDYIGVGPVFGTQSKDNPSPTLGIDGLRTMVAKSPFPVIAIGSICADQVSAVLEAGAHGVAVISGVVLQNDPEKAAREYRSAIRGFLSQAAQQ